QALQSGINLSPEFPRFVEFFYGTKTQNDKVDIKNLTFPNFVYCEFDPQGKYVKIGDAGFGNGEIKYLSADGKTSAAMSIRVILPTVGTFKEQARTKENYIGIRCYYNSGDTSVYFMQSGGFTPKEKEAVKVNSGGDFVTLTWLANATNPSNFDLKLSVNKDSKYNFDFDIEGSHFSSRIQFVRAKSEYLIDCKFETDKWIRSDASNVALKQGFEDNFRSIQVRFYKGGKIVLPSKIVIDEPSAHFVTISEPTADGIYTISCSKLIKFSTIATIDGKETQTFFSPSVGDQHGSEKIKIGNDNYVLAVFTDTKATNLFGHRWGEFWENIEWSPQIGLMKETQPRVPGGAKTYEVDVAKSMQLTDVTVSGGLDNGYSVQSVEKKVAGLWQLNAKAVSCGTTTFTCQAKYGEQLLTRRISLTESPKREEYILSLKDKKTLTIDELNSEISKITKPVTTNVQVILPAITISPGTAPNAAQDVVLNRNISICSGSDEARTVINGGLVINAPWESIAVTPTRLFNITFDGRTGATRRDGTGIRASENLTARDGLIISGCKVTGFGVGLDNKMIAVYANASTFYDNGIGFLVSENIGNSDYRLLCFEKNDTAIEITDKHVGEDWNNPGPSLSGARILNTIFIDNEMNVRNNTNGTLYMPRALYMSRGTGGVPMFTPPKKDSFYGNVEYSPYYFKDDLYNNKDSNYNGTTTFAPSTEKISLNIDDMPSGIEMAAIAAADAKQVVINIMEKDNSKQELVAKWIFNKETAGLLSDSGASLMAVNDTFNPTVKTYIVNNKIVAQVMSPPTGVKTQLSIPCPSGWGNAKVVKEGVEIPSTWDAAGGMLSFEVAKAGTYQISQSISVTEMMNGSVRELTITFNLPVPAEATAHVAVYDGSRLIEIKTAEVAPAQNPPATAKIKLDTSNYPNTYKVQAILLDKATQNPLTDKWSNEYTKP
ncbi:MAG: hypothetical protein RSB39_07730, partial [Oscillospiraceae bacterium]